MKKSLLKIVLSLSLAAILIPNSVYAIGVTPLRAGLGAEPGETVEGSVIVQNTLDEDQIVVLAKSDFFVSEKEDVQFFPKKDENNIYSMQDWIEFEENNVLVGPKSGKEMKYKITVPEGARSQGYYGAIFVSGQSPQKGQTPGALTVEASVAHLILFQVPGNLKTDVELKSYDMTEIERPDPEVKEVEFKAVVFNSGNTHTAPVGKVLIKDQDTKETTFEEILINKDKYNAMPQRQKTLAATWDYSKLEQGGYVAMFELQLDAEKSAKTETPFVINEDGGIEIGAAYEAPVIEETPLPAATDYTPWIVGTGIGIIVVLLIIFILLRPRKNANK